MPKWWFMLFVGTIVFALGYLVLYPGLGNWKGQLAVLQPYGAQAGSASGLFFFVQMAITAACGAIIAAITDGTEQPLLWVTAAASMAFALVWRLTKPVAAAARPPAIAAR